MYYDYKFRQLPPHQQDRTIDLRFASLMNDLGLPLRIGNGSGSPVRAVAFLD